MTTGKKLGVWMDHSSAHLTVFATEMTTSVIVSKFSPEEKAALMAKSESTMHNAQQHERSEFYKKVAEIIKDYDEVLLFGPTGAKLELFNILLADHRFAKVKLEVKNSDKLMDSQQQRFIRDFFSTHLVV